MKFMLLPWLVAPGIILPLVGIALFLLWNKKYRKVMALLSLVFVMGWTVNTVAFGRMLSLFLVKQIDGPVLADPTKTDLIVVLTGGMSYAGEKIGFLPTSESYRRVAVAYEVQGKVGSRIPVLISGGHTWGIKYPSEAVVSQSYFDRNNAQLTPTLIEKSSLNTYESSLQVAAIAQKRVAKTIILVTSEVHMPRSLAVYRARGIDVIPFPVLMLPRGKLKLQDYLPNWRGTRLTSQALYEYYGIFSYLLGGKISFSDLSYSG